VEKTVVEYLQPVELLPKQITDFKEEYILQGLPMRTISAMHRECERERLSECLNFHAHPIVTSIVDYGVSSAEIDSSLPFSFGETCDINNFFQGKGKPILLCVQFH